MAKAIAIYEGGTHSRTQVAIREDGQVFERRQDRTRYGYRWSAWSQTGDRWGDNLRANPEPTRSAGFSTLRLAKPNSSYVNAAALFNDRGEIRVRLP